MSGRYSGYIGGGQAGVCSPSFVGLVLADSMFNSEDIYLSSKGISFSRFRTFQNNDVVPARYSGRKIK